MHELAKRISDEIEALREDALNLRKALVVADKALEHYGDKGHWWIAPKAFAENVSERQRNLDVLFVVGVDYGEMRNGYDFAQKARTEIANILEGKE